MAKFRIALLLALLLAVGCQSQSASPVGSDWIETQLFFGLTKPGGERISDADWHDFVDHAITPRFPDGFTLLYGDGQYRGDDGAIHKEPSAILLLLHPPGDDAKLNEIARDYDQRFHQESVLRSDLPAKTTFISAPSTR
jgi:uncharacterized protein DUF3574